MFARANDGARGAVDAAGGFDRDRRGRDRRGDEGRARGAERAARERRRTGNRDVELGKHRGVGASRRRDDAMTRER